MMCGLHLVFYPRFCRQFNPLDQAEAIRKSSFCNKVQILVSLQLQLDQAVRKMGKWTQLPVKVALIYLKTVPNLYTQCYIEYCIFINIEVNVQEADALGVSLENFGETLTAEEAAELIGTDEQGAGQVLPGDEEMAGNSNGCIVPCNICNFNFTWLFRCH